MLEIKAEYGPIFPMNIPDAEYYREMFSPPLLKPWLVPGEHTGLHSLVTHSTLLGPEAIYTFHRLAKQCQYLVGEFWECGVFRGGAAEILAYMMANRSDVTPRTIRLFDTFEGMPRTSDEHDLHKEGDFLDTDWHLIQHTFARHPNVILHKGFIPDTFNGLESNKIAFLHCDVDIYQSILDCLAFCYPRMVPGGIILFDDYGHLSCPGARKSVDEFFADKPEAPFVLSSGQAFAVKI